ncbi:hypothetical protein B0H19DRAFT_1272539 [Mycena capillaripes]|nr:hypothetical protein B0H19DRAFT_1272468 [Mycena capillaripes]KAJ6533140.1 hypothetical protein B0H19DRAFT_1272539 [Mycena capillaripes]
MLAAPPLCTDAAAPLAHPPTLSTPLWLPLLSASLRRLFSFQLLTRSLLLLPPLCDGPAALCARLHFWLPLPCVMYVIRGHIRLKMCVVYSPRGGRRLITPRFPLLRGSPPAPTFPLPRARVLRPRWWYYDSVWCVEPVVMRNTSSGLDLPHGVYPDPPLPLLA